MKVFFNLTYFLKRCCICTAEIPLGNMNKYNDHFYCMWHVLYGYYFELYIFFSGRQKLHLFIYSFPAPPFPLILFLCLLLFLVKENKMHFKYVLISASSSNLRKIQNIKSQLEQYQLQQLVPLSDFSISFIETGDQLTKNHFGTILSINTGLKEFPGSVPLLKNKAVQSQILLEWI